MRGPAVLRAGRLACGVFQPCLLCPVCPADVSESFISLRSHFVLHLSAVDADDRHDKTEAVYVVWGHQQRLLLQSEPIVSVEVQ